MELIVSHNNVDFDGLASMIAAQKLYAKAVMVFTGKPKRNVQEFMALYKDSIDIKNPRLLDLTKIDRLIVVDTKNAKRIGHFQDIAGQPSVEVIIFDHHPDTKDDLQAHFMESETVGATTTILVEHLIKNEVGINSFEATAFALGIYEDTGSLSFASTTVRDVKAAAWLLEQGANLKVVRNYMERPLSEEQQDLFNILLKETKVSSFHGIKVHIASCFFPEYVGGLDSLTHKLGEIFDSQVVFTLVKMDDRIHMVGRSNLDTVSVGGILKYFGGAGHEKAAAATVKDQDLAQVLGKLQEILQENIKPEIRARDIMSVPVKTISLNQSIHEAGKIMVRYGHTGFPVIDGEKMVGIISRRDVEKAQYHGLGHAPVKGFMSRNVKSIEPDTPLSQIEQLMIEKDIGRLPVLEQDRLLGIISRTDVLRVIHGASVPHPFQSHDFSSCSVHEEDNLWEKMRAVLPSPVFYLIEQIGSYGDRECVRVYLVGGLVRDLLLGIPNVDLDVVVEGDGLSFARVLAETFRAKISLHEKFSTATLYLPDGLKVDVATARTEYYEFPAALPVVETGSLKQDLYRRDFTINAMAVGLNQDTRGHLVDFFCGKSDLEQGIIKVLYNLSFVEDPTRIMRGIRFVHRYGFRMEPETKKFALQALEQGLMEKVSFSRLKEEFMLILHEENFALILENLKEMGLWERIFPEWTISEEVIKLLKEIPPTWSWVKEYLAPLDLNLVILLVLCHHCSEMQIRTLNEKFSWSKLYRSALEKISWNKERIFQELATNSLSPSGVFSLIGDLPAEAIVYLILVSDCRQRKVIRNYLEAKKNLFMHISGEDLKCLGVKPGPRMKQLLDRVRKERLDGNLISRADEMTYVKALIQRERGD
ncbi:hypothetical protein DCMF_04180 [Candidatus Formimonas warabiya]|uniref:CBS domain-containing protein n=2 Tax=Formimonas warabiya TaxID=1761012 RepID=A0A3G1KNT2_FORW1|nr:hypothetical protein DCMF_04180 [Candidatus Formimonas warabiya]